MKVKYTKKIHTFLFLLNCDLIKWNPGSLDELIEQKPLVRLKKGEILLRLGFFAFGISSLSVN